jgi:hypothetical protein
MLTGGGLTPPAWSVGEDAKGPLGSSVKILAHNILLGCFLVPLKIGRKIWTSGIRENIPVPSKEKLTEENYGQRGKQRTKWSFREIF